MDDVTASVEREWAAAPQHPDDQGECRGRSRRTGSLPRNQRSPRLRVDSERIACVAFSLHPPRTPHGKQNGAGGRPAARPRGGRHRYHAKRTGRARRAQSKSRGQFQRRRAVAFALRVSARLPAPSSPRSYVRTRPPRGTARGRPVGRLRAPSGSKPKQPMKRTGYTRSTPPKRQVHLSARRHYAGEGEAQGSRVLGETSAQCVAGRRPIGDEASTSGKRAAEKCRSWARGRSSCSGRVGGLAWKACRGHGVPFSRHALEVKRPINSHSRHLVESRFVFARVCACK